MIADPSSFQSFDEAEGFGGDLLSAVWEWKEKSRGLPHRSSSPHFPFLACAPFFSCNLGSEGVPRDPVLCLLSNQLPLH